MGQQVGQLADDPPGLGQQAAVGDRALAVVDQPLPVERRAAQAALEGGQRLLAGRVGEHPVEQRERVVPGGAVGRPARGSSSPGSRIFSTSA